MAPCGGHFIFLAEREAKNTFPRISEEVQNSFNILHLGNFLR